VPELPVATLMGILGALAGLVIGFVARRLKFCTLSSIESALYGNNWVQARSWGLAIAVAILSTHLLDHYGFIQIGESFHLSPRIAIAGPIVGGIMFGMGMAAVGTCGFGAVLRSAGGDMRAAMVLITVAVFGYMTMRGIIGVMRMAVIEPFTIPLEEGYDASFAALTAQFLGGEIADFRLVTAIVISLLIAVWCLKDRKFRSNPAAVAGGTIVGLIVAFGWFSTGYIGADDFDPQPLRSLGFVSPSAESLVYLMTFTGATIEFGIGATFGTVAGGFLAAISRRQFRLEAFDDPREMLRHLIGAAMMGIGGVTAIGCTVGQGLSGVSTLAIPSFVALASIIVGAIIGLKLLMHGGLIMSVRTFLHGE